MKYNNFFITLMLWVSLSSTISFGAEANQPTASWWQKARTYMASLIPQAIKNRISSSNTPAQQKAFLEQKDAAKKAIVIKLEAILNNRKTKNFKPIPHIKALIATTFEQAQQFSFDAESEINKAIDTVMKKIDPTDKENSAFFANIKMFIEDKLKEKNDSTQINATNQPAAQISPNFKALLEEKNYETNFIKSLQLQYKDNKDLEQVLFTHYYDDYRNQIHNLSMSSKDPQKIYQFIEQKKAECLLSPGAIARGQEGPALIGPELGTNRGGRGLRMKALNTIQKEIFEHYTPKVVT